MAKKQKELPGMEKPSIEDVERAADEYVDARDKRMALTKQEVETRDALIAAMRAHKIKSYEYDGRLVTLEATAKIKVKSVADEDEADANDS